MLLIRFDPQLPHCSLNFLCKGSVCLRTHCFFLCSQCFFLFLRLELPPLHLILPGIIVIILVELFFFMQHHLLFLSLTHALLEPVFTFFVLKQSMQIPRRFDESDSLRWQRIQPGSAHGNKAFVLRPKMTLSFPPC
mmetsp:Transcript_12412/g.29753  ORF Transcript_12412/g.29753 Transcript_12412/m.29753 type:complete len:136 (-) Transcript_12412:58-465(-)